MIPTTACHAIFFWKLVVQNTTCTFQTDFAQDVLAQDFQSLRKYCTHNHHPTCIRKGKLDQMRYLTRTENLHMTSGALLKTLTQQEAKMMTDFATSLCLDVSF
jgi:hypothetical protein